MCASSASTGPRGGQRVTAVPTATASRPVGHDRDLLLRQQRQSDVPLMNMITGKQILDGGWTLRCGRMLEGTIF